MQLSGDTTPFWAEVRAVQSHLARLSDDGTLDGLTVRFNRLLNELPSDFFLCEPVPAVATGGIDPIPDVVVRPSPRLHALAAALRALDLNVGAHLGSSSMGSAYE